MLLNPRVFGLTAPVRRGVAGVTAVGLAVVATNIAQGLLMARVLTLLFQGAPHHHRAAAYRRHLGAHAAARRPAGAPAVAR